MNPDKHPRVIDLAHEAPFALAGLAVRPSTREIVAGDRRQVLEPRIMQVLVALAHRRGEVVSRDDLIASCWGGRAVGEDAIDRCISAIRRLADTYGSFSVETIIRVGYRLNDVVPRRASLWRRPRIWAAAALLIFASLAGPVWLLRDRIFFERQRPPAALKIAVLPFEPLSSGQEVRYFADSLHDEIVGALSENQITAVSRNMSTRFRGPDARQEIDQLGARLLLDGTARRDGDTMYVRVHLDDPRAQTTLWSREFDAPVGEASVLQSRVAHRMIAILACSREALRPTAGLGDANLVARYLHACDLFADWDVHAGYDPRRNAEWLETERALTSQAPDFAPPHYAVAVAAAISAKGASREAAAASRREAQAHLDRGLALDPQSPMSYAVREMLLPATHWGERERLLRQAVTAAPAFPLTNSWLGGLLAETGRLQEAAEFTQRSAAGDMVYDWGIFNAAIVCGGEQPKQAITDVAGFRKLMPESVFAQDIHIICLSSAGRWDEAQRVLESLPRPRAETPAQSKAAEAFLVAASSRAPADRDKARRLALAKADEGPAALAASISWLAALGFVDDAFRLADRYDPDVAPSVNPNIFLFFPATQNLRRDPRFMRLATRIGLVEYWRSSGHWPDFCADRRLAYDCKAEAAKATTSQRTS
jgi:DNA-binding winged helix-turn-helix (wHTH) protein/TolB-like protein